MENDHVSEMYGSSDESNDVDMLKEDFRIRKNGMLTEVTIAGERLTVVDPAAVQMLERTISELRSRVKLLDQDLRTLSANLRRSDSILREVRSELERKVSYE